MLWHWMLTVDMGFQWFPFWLFKLKSLAITCSARTKTFFLADITAIMVWNYRCDQSKLFKNSFSNAATGTHKFLDRFLTVSQLISMMWADVVGLFTIASSLTIFFNMVNQTSRGLNIHHIRMSGTFTPYLMQMLQIQCELVPHFLWKTARP